MKPATYRRQLRVVEDTPPAVDLYAKWKAEIASIDWAQTHISGDRREPVYLNDRPRRAWRG